MAEAPLLAIREIELYERPVKLRLPFRFGVVTLTECPQAFARVTVELRDGSTARGAAAEMMAPKWFDKNLELSNEDNFQQLRDVLAIARDGYMADRSPATAFGHFARNYDGQLQACEARGYNPLLACYGPALIDRAILDALCRLESISFGAAMRRNVAGIGDERREFAGFDYDGFLSQLKPQAAIEARHTVGLVDAITAADLTERVNDGLPETFEEVVRAYGHRCFKLKVSGNLQADLDRLRAIAAVLERKPERYYATLDGNEQYESAEAVAELMAAMRSDAALGRLYEAILFVEQPIARKLALDVRIDDEALGKPVIIDESDGELDSFLRARSRGYAGVSSKTCKGFYKSFLNAARCVQWNKAKEQSRYFLSAEDLTTQAGLSVQQDLALVSLLGIQHVERNGHHYVNGMAALPEAEQQDFLDLHPDLYQRSHGAVRLRIENGRIELISLECRGFASAAMPDFAAMLPLGG